MRCRLYIGVRPDTIIFLCEESEETARPWKESGYTVVCIDLAVDRQDVRLIRVTDLLALLRNNGLIPFGVFAMPPCTHFAGSGARWWKGKGDAVLLEALSVSDACIRIAESLRSYGLQWFVLENPVGRLAQYLGKPRMTYQPYQYGDPYTKRTCLWGWGFNTRLPVSLVDPTEGSKMWRLPESSGRARMRSKTPAGFAKAFFEANRMAA